MYALQFWNQSTPDTNHNSEFTLKRKPFSSYKLFYVNLHLGVVLLAIQPVCHFHFHFIHNIWFKTRLYIYRQRKKAIQHRSSHRYTCVHVWSHTQPQGCCTQVPCSLKQVTPLVWNTTKSCGLKPELRFHADKILEPEIMLPVTVKGFLHSFVICRGLPHTGAAFCWMQAHFEDIFQITPHFKLPHPTLYVYSFQMFSPLRAWPSGHNRSESSISSD